VTLDPVVVEALTARFWPAAFLRVTPMAHSGTPLGMGFGATRFASPTDAFKVLYIAEDLATAVAETLIRDRFVGRRRRIISRGDVELWGVTSVHSRGPLQLLDIRTDGLLRLGAPTDAGRAKAQRQGRRFSQEVHDQTRVDGILYRSRLTGAVCCAIYERAVRARKLSADPVVEAVRLVDFEPALRSLGVALAQ